jgi:hypothetical protein
VVVVGLLGYSSSSPCLFLWWAVGGVACGVSLQQIFMPLLLLYNNNNKNNKHYLLLAALAVHSAPK